MNAARLDSMAASIRTKAKPCPLCYAPVGGYWTAGYLGFTLHCTAPDCGCKLERHHVSGTSTTIFSEALKAWNRRG